MTRVPAKTVPDSLVQSDIDAKTQRRWADFVGAVALRQVPRTLDDSSVTFTKEEKKELIHALFNSLAFHEAAGRKQEELRAGSLNPHNPNTDELIEFQAVDRILAMIDRIAPTAEPQADPDTGEA